MKKVQFIKSWWKNQTRGLDSYLQDLLEEGYIIDQVLITAFEGSLFSSSVSQQATHATIICHKFKEE